MRSRLLVIALATQVALGSTGASARPFSVDDLLQEQSLGRTLIDPQGRWAMIERRDPLRTLGRYDAYLETPAALSRVLVVDLKQPAPSVRLLHAGRGVTLSAFSPSGAREAVTRFTEGRLTLGVATPATGAVRWLPITPEISTLGQSLAWLSERELLVIARPDHSLPWPLREGHVSADTLPRLWAASAEGRGAHTVVGSGRYRDLRRRPSPRVLLRVNLATRRVTPLAQGEFIDLEISPDRRRVALFETGADVQPREVGPVQGEAGTATQATVLSILTLASGRRITPCATCDALSQLLAWSPSGRLLLSFMRDPGQVWPDGRLMVIDVATGAGEQVGAGLRPVIRYRPEIVAAGWMGERPIVFARPRTGGRPDWYRLDPDGVVDLTQGLADTPRELSSVNSDSLTMIARDAVWRIDRDGAARQLSAGPAQTVREPGARPDGRQASAPPAGSWITDQGRLSWLDGDGLHPAQAAPPGSSRIVAVSRAFGAALVRTEDPRGLETLDWISADAHRRRLITLNPQLAAIPPPRLRSVVHRGPDGQALTSWLCLPATAVSGPPPPLVVEPYAGASYPFAPWDVPGGLRNSMLNVRALVGHGYAVLVPSLPPPRGASGPMAGLGERLNAIVDAAAATPDLKDAFDPTRVALWGYSFGGYTVDAAIGQTERFRAAIAISGPSDFISQWETMPAIHRSVPEEGLWNNWSAGAVETGQEEMGAPPWVVPQLYLANSPVMAADRVHTPLMLIHGDQDVIPLAQSEAMFSALYRQDKDAILVTYWGEGHVLTSPGNIRDLFSRAFAFLDAHLASGEAAARWANPEPGFANGAPRPRPTPPKGYPPAATPR